MNILSFLMFGFGVSVGWLAEKQDFWLLVLFIAYLPLLTLAILTAERLAENKRSE